VEMSCTSPVDLSGKVALVTGGNGGIGLGMADALAQAGATVVVWGTNAGKNSDAEKTLRAHGVRVLTRKVDVSRENEVVGRHGRRGEGNGPIDAVFANAASVAAHRSPKMTTELFTASTPSMKTGSSGPSERRQNT